MRRHTWPALLLTLGFVLAGCAGAAPPTPTPTAPPTPTPTAPPTPTPTAPPTPSPTLAATDLCAAAGEFGENELAAGDYLVTSTEPQVSLTLPDGFTGICAEGTVTLFGTDGIVAIILPVAMVASAGVGTPVEPTIEAISAAIDAAAAETTDPQPVEIGGFEGVEFVVTVDERGVGLRSAADRGWGFNNEENETGGFTLIQLDGAVAGFIRHGDDPLAVYDEVLDSIQFVGE